MLIVEQIQTVDECHYRLVLSDQISLDDLKTYSQKN
jgi:hypothetical protein